MISGIRDKIRRVNPTELVVGKGIRKTRTGDVLVEVKANPDNKAKFGNALSTAMGVTSSLRPLKSKTQVEIRDLDGVTEEAELTSALDAVTLRIENRTQVFRCLSVVEHSLSYYTNKDHVMKLYEYMLVD